MTRVLGTLSDVASLERNSAPLSLCIVSRSDQAETIPFYDHVYCSALEMPTRSPARVLYQIWRMAKTVF
jgi:hypothetical protein